MSTAIIGNSTETFHVIVNFLLEFIILNWYIDAKKKSKTHFINQNPQRSKLQCTISAEVFVRFSFFFFLMFTLFQGYK